MTPEFIMYYKLILIGEVIIGGLFLAILFLDILLSIKKRRQLDLQIEFVKKALEVHEKMTMEKYGVDLNSLPATDEQIKKLNKLASDQSISYKLPANRVEADKLIEELSKGVKE